MNYFLAAAFFFVGGAKLIGVKPLKKQFADFGYLPWVIYVVGAGEVAGAAALLTAELAFWALVALGSLMLGALGAHLKNSDPLPRLAPALTLFILIVIALIRMFEEGARAP